MLEWVQSNDVLVFWMAVVSFVSFIGSLILVPILVVRIPEDYFSHHGRHRTHWGDAHPIVRAALLIIKNLLGVLFVFAGLAMLVLPGQGLLTIFIGVMLLNFPGKYRLECWIISRPAVFQSINWLRKRGGRPPLLLS